MMERDRNDLLRRFSERFLVGHWPIARVKLETENWGISIMVLDLHRVEPQAYNIISKELYAHRYISNRTISHACGDCAVELLRIIVR